MLYFMHDLYVIYMLRDPRDVVVSKHPWDKNKYWTNLKVWKMWTEMGRELKGHPRFIIVSYEELVSRPDAVQNVIAKRLPFLVKTCSFSVFYRKAKPSSYNLAALKGLRPVSTNSVGNWRNHKARLVNQLNKYGSISEDLIELGYESNDHWEKELIGVPPDPTPTHPSVFLSEKYITRKLRWNKLRAMRVLINHWWLVIFFNEKLHQK